MDAQTVRNEAKSARRRVESSWGSGIRRFGRRRSCSSFYRSPAIPLSGRICAVSDVFDALTSKRPYKEAWPIDRAIAYINAEISSHFDPELVRAFHAALPKICNLKEQYADVAV